MTDLWAPPKPTNPFSAACAKLRACGYMLSPSDIIGLTWVERLGFGQQELTMNQVVDLAAQQA